MIYNDAQIHKWATTGGVTPFDEACINPASIDLRLGNMYRVPEKKSYREFIKDFNSLWSARMINHDEYEWSEPKTIPDIGLFLFPGDFVLCHSFEVVSLPDNLVGKLFLKSSAGRRGLEHLHAGYIDPGFSGQLTFEIYNHWPGNIRLFAGECLLQMTLEECLAVTTSYRHTGRYQHQRGPTPQREGKS